MIKGVEKRNDRFEHRGQKSEYEHRVRIERSGMSAEVKKKGRV